MTRSSFPFVPEICFEFPLPIGRQCFPIFSTPTFPGPPATPNTVGDGPTAWRAYREFSRAVLLLSELEQRAPIELIELREAETAKTASLLERTFVLEAFRQSALTAEEAAAALRLFRSALPQHILDDATALKDALARTVPDLAQPVSAAISEVLSRHATPSDWMQTVLGMLDRRIDVYGQVAGRLRAALHSGTCEAVDQIWAILERLHRADLPAIPSGARMPANEKALRDAMEQGAKTRAEQVKNGVPEILASAEERRVAERVAVLHPDLGLSADPRPVLPVWCILGGPCWWKVTGIAVAFALSSHNVE